MDHKPFVLIDLNILLDVLQRRQPFYEASVVLQAAVEIGRIEGFVAADSIKTLFYVVQKGRSTAVARSVLTNLPQFIRISPVDQNIIMAGAQSGFS